MVDRKKVVVQSQKKRAVVAAQSSNENFSDYKNDKSLNLKKSSAGNFFELIFSYYF